MQVQPTTSVLMPDQSDSNLIPARIQLPAALPPHVLDWDFVLNGNLYTRDLNGEYEELDPYYGEIMQTFPHLQPNDIVDFQFEYDPCMMRADVYVGILLTCSNGEEGEILAEGYLPAIQFLQGQRVFSLEARE